MTQATWIESTSIDTNLPLLPLCLDGGPATLRTVLGQEGVPFVEHSLCQAPVHFVVFDSREKPAPCLAPGQSAIDLHAVRELFVTDPFEALESRRARRYEWTIESISAGPLLAGPLSLGPLSAGPLSAGPLSPREEVSDVDRGWIRAEIIRWLREQTQQRGGVWITVGRYPFPYRSAFNFRLDHDAFLERDFHATVDAIGGHEGSVSHFVCAATHQEAGAALDRLRGQDVGGHGFRHHAYRDPQENFRNVRRGIETLRDWGFQPMGHVAPHGRYQAELNRRLASIGVTYGGEFGLAHDDLPFRPEPDGAWQIPVHPVCLGVGLEAAARAGMAPDQAATLIREHFSRVLNEKEAHAEPIFLYGHPDGRIGRFPVVLSETLAEATARPSVWRTTLTRFADWWTKRESASLTAYRDANEVRLLVHQPPPGYDLAIEIWRGEQVAQLSISGDRASLPLDGIEYYSRPRPKPDSKRPVAERASWKSRILRSLDWEHVTPLEEIEARSWRGNCKRTLRRVRSLKRRAMGEAAA